MAGKNIYLGNVEIEGCYFGDNEVEACYLGDNLVYVANFTGIEIKPLSQTFGYTGGTGSFNIKSSEDFTISFDNELIDLEPVSGTSGETQIMFTAGTNTASTDYTTIITASTIGDAYSATTTITIATEPTELTVPEYVVKSESNGTYDITVSTPVDWFIDGASQYDEWLTLSTTAGTSGTSTVTLTFQSFYGVTSRFAFLTASTTDLTVKKLIVVRQQYQGTGTTANNMLYHAPAQVTKNLTQGSFSPAETSHTFDSNTYIGEYCFSSTYSGVNGTFRAKFLSSGSDVKLVGCTDITRVAGKNGMFNTCTGLRCIEFGEGIVNIGSATMPSATTLHEIIIGSTIQTIAENQTVGDASVNTIMILATTPPQINGNPFNGCASSGYLLVPKASLSDYETWASNIASIQNWMVIGI